MINEVLKNIRPKKGDVFIDIGSNKGEEALAAWKAGMEVHSFEPNPYVVEDYMRPLLANTDVKINVVACGKENGLRKLYHKGKGRNYDRGASLIPDKAGRAGMDWTEVKVINIGYYLENLNKDIFLLKVDAEGSEWEILQSLIDHDMVDRLNYIYVEEHARKIPTSWYAQERDIIKEYYAKRGKIINSWQ